MNTVSPSKPTSLPAVSMNQKSEPVGIPRFNLVGPDSNVGIQKIGICISHLQRMTTSRPFGAFDPIVANGGFQDVCIMRPKTVLGARSGQPDVAQKELCNVAENGEVHRIGVDHGGRTDENAFWIVAMP